MSAAEIRPWRSQRQGVCRVNQLPGRWWCSCLRERTSSSLGSHLSSTIPSRFLDQSAGSMLMFLSLSKRQRDEKAYSALSDNFPCPKKVPMNLGRNTVRTGWWISFFTVFFFLILIQSSQTGDWERERVLKIRCAMKILRIFGLDSIVVNHEMFLI